MKSSRRDGFVLDCKVVMSHFGRRWDGDSQLVYVATDVRFRLDLRLGREDENGGREMLREAVYKKPLKQLRA